MAPGRLRGGSPTLTIEAAPAYEFVVAIASIFEERDTMEVGSEWFAEVEARAGGDLLARLTALSQGESDPWFHLISLVYASPAPRDVPSFLAYLRKTDADEITLTLLGYYERGYRRAAEPEVMRRAIAGDRDAQRELHRSYYPEWGEWHGFLRSVFERDPAATKAELIELLEAWEASVWRTEEPKLMPILERDAEAKRGLATELPLERFTEVATNGVEYLARPGVREVVLTPTFVNRPWVSTTEYRDVDILTYPVADESVTAETDAPPLRLVRLSKALGDERRLRILRILASGDKTLMELAEQFDVPKTTMHHHMIALRSAGLVTLTSGTKRYRLRRDALPDVGELLRGYVGAATDALAAPAPTARATRSTRRRAAPRS
ncbi:MAG: winged helix-turn-helix domain-containing protein [Chloroflexota bacterium]|nr:winged helix-turn-helix domain-containing protein [Chloroflexota bacterium]